MRPTRYALLASLIATPATAGTVTVTLPRVAIAEYKKPYVVGWVEPAGGGAARTIFVWYDVKKVGREAGTKWLNDLRSWWRKGGRATKLPADGVSAATRGPGSYKVNLPSDLAAGNYVLSVEAAREHGGREIVSVPISVPANTGRGAGKSELGAITVSK